MIGAVELTGLLGDAVYIGITVAFFALALALLRACERIVGPDDASAKAASPGPEQGASDELEAVGR